jgi:programmed cell death protein 4
MIACFLARAVVDEVLPPAFLSNENNNRPGCEVIEKAIGLLNREHSTARLERIWGPGDGRPVDELKAAMTQLLQEYLLSRELDEAARCVKELECSYFHHELVKRGVVTAMELDGPAEENLDAMAALFGFLVKNLIVSEHQVQKGLSRLRTILPDISLDVPSAPQLLDMFEGLLAENLKVTE